MGIFPFSLLDAMLTEHAAEVFRHVVLGGAVVSPPQQFPSDLAGMHICRPDHFRLNIRQFLHLAPPFRKLCFTYSVIP